MATKYRISEIAEKTGVTSDAIRYYERLGVLPRPARTAGGLRTYGDGLLPRVRFIQQAQAMGLTLKDVKELVANEGRSGQQRCRRVRDLLKSRLADVDARLKEMHAFRRTLRIHLQDCEHALEQEQPVCPVMSELGASRQ
ncbi:MAG: MerR family transcriptional regulator [Acidobacteria bacterium]|nr:MerR family transcriptional regulator [Acidobacteriota bacterium]